MAAFYTELFVISEERLKRVHSAIDEVQGQELNRDSTEQFCALLDFNPQILYSELDLLSRLEYVGVDGSTKIERETFSAEAMMVLQGGCEKGRDIGLMLVEDLLHQGGSQWFDTFETFTQDESLHEAREMLRQFLLLHEGCYAETEPWPFFRRDALESLLSPEETVVVQSLLPSLRMWRDSIWPSDMEANRSKKYFAKELDGIIETLEASKDIRCYLQACSWGT